MPAGALDSGVDAVMFFCIVAPCIYYLLLLQKYYRALPEIFFSRSFLFRILLPSSHLPYGDGIVWKDDREKVFVA